MPAVADLDTMRAHGCVVTGGLGFIGSNLVHRLVAHGIPVRIVDAVVAEHGANRRNIDGLDVEVLEADVGDPRVAPMLRGVSHVFNLAGQVSHTASMVDPVRDLELNAITHARFLETLRHENPTARVVHTSTRQVYGRVAKLPVDELTAARPIDVNGVAKLAGEHLHMVYSHAHRMSITSLRLTNVYGPRQRLTSDELGFLPVFVRKALRGEDIELFGGGEQRRDLLHVDDVVDAILAATAPEALGAVFNVGHVRSHSLREIADTLTDLAGTGSRVVATPWPPVHRRIDIGSFETDSSAIRSRLGWEPRVDLPTGLRWTLDFYRERPWYLSST
ncbi:MAG: NAD-dependent epimerase/dehydratase family protein [Acidimicrobiales bacterium]|nr:NAD-dependent epimerase/dehydratase family protein [Acidimicrobiales bacterium]